MFAIVLAYLMKPACSWKEVFSVLMKGNRHAPVAQVESLLNPIAMMDVYIQVKNSRIDLQEFQNCKDYIVDVAETTGL